MKKDSKIVMFLKALFVLAVLFGLVAPISLFAQTTLRYGRNSVNGAIYLLPNDYTSTLYSPEGRTVTSGFSVSCSPSLINANINQTITWFSSVTGGSGSYIYNWNGTDGLVGNTSSLSANYSTNGQKSATLTVTSGNRVITVSCGSTQIGPYASQYTQSFIHYGLGASCYATPERIVPGESVTWLAILSGTTASTTYAWDGTDGLIGDRPLISKTYTANGVKAALLTVTSGSERVVAACTNAVTVGPRVSIAYKPPIVSPSLSVETSPTDLELKALCTSSVAKATVGEEVRWQSAAIGGTGAYRYSWSGDDGLAGTSATTSKRYETAGAKKTTVAVSSGDNMIGVSCAPVEITKNGKGLLAGAFSALIGLLFGPLGFILGLILAILIGIIVARRKKKQEEKESEESDHVQ